MNEENQNIDDVMSYNFGSPDLSLPENPVPIAQENKPEVAKDECDAAFKFAFVGAGQGGTRIAEAFYDLGYRKLAAINTAQQDLNTSSLNNKLCIGDGGAGKNPSVAKNLYEEKKEDVLDFLRDSFGENLDRIFVCAGAGGGTGSGTAASLVHTCEELLKTIRSNNQKVGVILALPKISEGSLVSANAFRALDSIWNLAASGKISPLILVDNEKINSLYPNLSVSQFWTTANRSTAGLFHLFNMTAAKDSSYSSFDSNDYKQILDSGLMSFGAAPVQDWSQASNITRTVRDNLKNNLLSGGLDLSTGTTAGVVIIGGREVLDNIPQDHLDKAFDQFTRILKNGGLVHRGIYSGDQPTLTVYTAIGGLTRPHAKFEELKKLARL